MLRKLAHPHGPHLERQLDAGLRQVGVEPVAAAQRRDPLVERLAGDPAGGGPPRPSTSRWRRAPRRSRASPRRSAAGCARRPGRRARSRASAPSSEPRRTAGPAAAATRRARSAPASASRTCHGSPPRLSKPTAVTSRRTRSRASAAGSRSPRTATSARGPSTSASSPIRSSRPSPPLPVERPQRRAGEVDADGARPAQDVGARAGPALGEPLEQPGPVGRGHLLLRRLGGHRHREQERRLVDRQQVELVAAAGQDVEARGGVDRARVKRRRQALAVAVERVHERHVEPVLRRGSDRRAVGALEQHLRLEHVAQRGDEPGRAEALAGRLAELGLEADGPAQGGELARDEPLVHDVRDVDEAHVAAEDEQRQLVAAARLDERRRRGVGGLEADACGPRPGQPCHQRLDLRAAASRRGRSRSSEGTRRLGSRPPRTASRRRAPTRPGSRAGVRRPPPRPRPAGAPRGPGDRRP